MPIPITAHTGKLDSKTEATGRKALLEAHYHSLITSKGQKNTRHKDGYFYFTQLRLSAALA